MKLRRLQTVLGYVIAAVCLVWVLHDTRFAEVFRRIGRIHWGLVAIALACDVLSYSFQGIRWVLLLRPIGRLNVVRATQAIYAGLFTNEIVPFRAGEVVRAFFVSRWIGRDITSIVPSIAVERLCDGLWVAIAVGVTALFVTLPRDLMRGEEVLGIAALAGSAVFIYLVLRAQPEEATESRGGLRGFFGRIAAGVRTIGISRNLGLAFIASSGILVFEILAFWLVMRAYGLQLSIWAGAAVMMIVHLGTALPNAPSNLGTYQFFTVVGLSLFLVEKTVATGFSLVVFVLLTIPLWVIGLIAIGQSGMTLGAVRREIARLRLPRLRGST